MKFVSNREWALLARILAFSIVPTLGGLLRVVELGGGPTIIPENPRALANPPPIVLHIFSSFIFCAIGALQFLSSVRHHYPKVHRAAGPVIAVAGCVSALTALWMTHFFVFPEELQGVPLYWTRIVLGLVMIGLIGKAVMEIRSRNVLGHGAAMLRAYAIGQGASTQAILGIGWTIASGAEPTGAQREGMMVSAWGLNLLIAELLIRKFVAPRTVPA